MLNIGIIGRNHGIKHLVNLKKYHSERASVRSLAYKNSSKKLNIEADIKIYHDFKKMIDETELDALVLANPHNLTREIIEYSAEKIKFFLIEKPVGCDSSEIRKIKQTLSNNNCTALIGHHRRFSPKLQALKKIIDTGTIGNVFSFTSIWCIKKNDEYYNSHSSNWRIHADRGGGPLTINGIHEIDTLRFLFGEIKLAKAFSGKNNRHLSTEENITSILKMKNNIIGTLLIGDNIPSPYSYEKTMRENHLFPSSNVDFLKIFGDKGVITFPSLTIYSYEGSGDWFSTFTSSSIRTNIVRANPLRLEMEHFLRVIDGKDQPLVSIDDALNNMIVLDKIKKDMQNESIDL